MLLTFQNFYKKFGIRILPQLIAPHTADVKYLEFPQEAIYHFVSYDGATNGPANDDYLLRNIRHQVPVFQITDLASLYGNPRHQPVNVASIVKDYHHTHRHTRPLREVRMALTDKNTPIVFNYSLLGKLFHYQQSIYANYYRWRNVFETIVASIVKNTEDNQRQHFIPLGIPRVLPSLMQLNTASSGMTQTMLKAFHDSNSLILLELWKWVTEDRALSAFSKIPSNKLHLVNFIFQEGGQWFVLNLGMLNSWRTPLEGEDYDSCVYKSKQHLDGTQIAKRILRLYISTMELRTLAAKAELLEAAERSRQEAQTSTNVVDDDIEDPMAVGDDGEPIAEQKEADPSTPTPEDDLKEYESVANEINKIADFEELDQEEFLAHIRQEDAQIDADLRQLDDIVARKENELVKAKSEVKQVIEERETKSLEIPIQSICDKYVEDGVISPAEHARFTRLANSYKHIPSPDGVTTLDKFSEIHPDTLKITTTAPMADTGNVLDKTMLHSTLNEFDSRYIEHILHKDYSNAVLSIQRAGIAVTNYQVKKSEDVLGAYEEHVLKIAPVIGVPSTLRFKVPVVDKDGIFTSNGVKYRMRKQRVDIPFRKTAPNRVALTSYYGKCFLTRGRSSASNYSHWLKNQVMAQAVDNENTNITEPVVSNVFDQTLKAPISYSALSGSFKAFTCKGYRFLFDHAELVSTYPAEVVESVERDGSLLIATDGTKYLFIDKFGALYEYADTVPLPLGSLEEFLGVSIANSPVEYVSIGVFGKDIPLGVVMGLEMGLLELIRVLGARHREVPAGTRLNLQPSEYAISFNDMSLVLTKDDRLATLILSGFNEYWKTLRLFSIESFNKRGVYQNLLDTNGISTRYIREIDLMFQMFVDPITRDLLEELKEPTTFKGLLLRAAQVLQNDMHPDELDPAFMRIKGYERLSGAIYTELVQSIRQHNGRIGKSNASIEMNPYAVWRRIMEDPSKSQAQEINPIKQVKETEAVTYAGTGGRNKRSMTKNTRVYHRNDMGTISESTVDSGDVAINVYTSANPQFTSLRGMSKRFDMKKQGATSLLSTSALLSPCSDTDDPKRVEICSF